MYLVTGATGRIGGETARLLRERGLPVRALVRDTARAGALEALGVEVVAGDQSRPETLGAAVAGATGVLLASSNDPGQEEREGNVVDAAVAAGAGRIVKVSALGSTPDAPVGILRSHAAVEARLAAAGADWTSLRPSTFMQNFMLYADTIKPLGQFFGSMEDAPVAWVDARDVAAVAACCLADGALSGGQAVEVTGPELLSYTEAAAVATRAIGREIAYVDVPPAAARQGMVDAGLPDWLADDLTALAELFKGPVGRTCTTVVADVTGRSPRTLEAYLRENAAHFLP
jgi:uncharacterized protein YbjT (DUF2867 family)